MTVRKSKTARLPMIGGVVALSLSAALSAYCFILPTWHWGYEWSEARSLGFIGVGGVLASGAVAWSAWKGGWAWVGLVLGLVYLGSACATPLAIATIHNYGVIAFFVVWFAGMNVLSGRRR